MGIALLKEGSGHAVWHVEICARRLDKIKGEAPLLNLMTQRTALTRWQVPSMMMMKEKKVEDGRMCVGECAMNTGGRGGLTQQAH